MSTENFIERYGGITKEEPLSCVDNEILLKNTCVLEAVSPFFGYYTQVQYSTKPQMLYLVTDEFLSLETLMRTTNKIQKLVKFPIDAVTGSITLFNQTCHIIRFLNIPKYDQIATLQKLYLEHGLVYKKKVKSFQDQMAMIKLRRFFNLIPFDNGLYLEHGQPNFGYFKIPDYIDWENFKSLTTEVKYDTDLLYFDAATAYIYENRSITDLVRIYRENLTIDKLKAIRDKYFKLIG
jgi:hypothetical protein